LSERSFTEGWNMPKISASARRALTEERRKQILKAATKVFAAKGFDRATIADVAREAGIAEGSIYNYFKNKGDLLVGIPRQVIQPPVEAARTKMAISTSGETPLPEQMLTTTAESIIAVFQRNAHIFRILISALPTLPQATRGRYLNQVILYATDLLETYFKAQIKCGVFRRGLNPRVLSRAFIGMFFPFVMLAEVLQADTTNWDYDQLIAEIVPLFLRGALADEPKRKTKRSKDRH
jgi:TetR/AcrR family fatty acid metabolism transcriptional regulator